MWKKMFFRTKNERESAATGDLSAVDMERLPRHIAMIMDGNGRWAKGKGMPRSFGHKAGVDTLKKIAKAANKWGVQALTAYAFSTENWKRPQQEVDFLMRLFSEYLEREIDELDRDGMRIRFIGRIEELSRGLQDQVESAQKRTEKNPGLVLTLAVNYGSRDELTRSVKIIAERVRSGALAVAEITEDTVERSLYTGDLPPVDLLIRSSGDLRISNFLLWQLAYAELWFTPVNWPDFTPELLLEAIAAYQRRDRRFGGLESQ